MQQATTRPGEPTQPQEIQPSGSPVPSKLGLHLRRPDVAAVLVLLASTLGFFWPMVRPWAPRQYVVDGDFSRQFFPYRAFAAQEWLAGRIPLWNPDMFAGHPFQADPQTGVFYPFALLNAIIFARHGFPFVALEGEVVLHTFLAAAFTYLLAVKLTGSRLGGLVAGIAFGLGGFITSYPAQQLAVLESAVWLPLIVLCLELAVERPIRWPWLAGAAVAFGMAFLAGHTQTALFIGYATGGYLLWRLARRRVPWHRIVLALIAFPVGAVGIGAVQLLPAAEFVGQSTRSTMDYVTAAHGYLPSALWQVFVPLWHGEKALSVGVAALFLAVVGAIASRREPLAYWLGVGLIALPLSTGGATPLFWLLYTVAPGWNLFKDQERVIYLFSFATALLAARGVAELERASVTSRLWRFTPIAAGAASAAALVVYLLGPWLYEPAPLQTNLAVDVVVLGVLAAALALGRWQGTIVPIAGMAIVCLVAAEAFAINFGNNLGPVSPDARPRLAATATFMRQLPEPFRFRGISEDVFPANYGALLDTPTIGGDSPIVARRINEMLNGDADWRVWQILNVKFFVSDGGPLAGLSLVFKDGALNTYAMGDSLPRAWGVSAVEVARDPAEAKQLILAPGYHPGNVVVLEKAPTIGPIAGGVRPDVRITHLDAQHVAIDASAAQNSMLVLANQFYPDWQAYRDGQPVPIFQANYLAMAFELPPGQHHFDVVYRPTTFYAGAALSIFSLLGALYLVLRSRLPRTWRAPPPDDTGRRSTAIWWSAAVALLGIAFALRLHDLGLPNLSADEWFMLRNHDEGALWILNQAHTFEPHPLIYYLGLAGWIELAGRTELAIRFPSAGFGVLLVAALIGLGRSLLGQRAALVAGALGALNPYQIAESQNARNYEMVTAASAVASLLFLRALQRGRRRDWIAYAIGMLVALNVHYDAALVFAAHVAFALLRWLWALPGRRTVRYPPVQSDGPSGRRAGPIAIAVVAAAFAGWLAYAAPALIAYNGYFPDPVGIDQVLTRSLATFSLGVSATILSSLLFVALAVVGVVWLTAERNEKALFLGLWVLLPIGAVSILFLKRPMFDERYLIVLAPGFLLAVAAAIDRSVRHVWPIGVVALGGALVLTSSMVGAAYAQPLNDRGNYRAMARYISAYGQADDPIIATGYGQANLLGYYYHGPRPIQIVDDPATLRATLPGLADHHAGVWLVPYFHDPADVAAIAILDDIASPAAERWFVTIRCLYFASASRLSSVATPGTSFDDRLTLTSAAVSRGKLVPGDAVSVQLNWKVNASMPTPKLSLRLLDASGIAAQSDTIASDQPSLPAGNLVTRSGLFIPLALPPGTYIVAVLLYHPDSGAPLPVVSTLPQRDATLTLGQIAVGDRAQPLPIEEAGIDLTTPTGFPNGITSLGHDPLATTLDVGTDLAFRVLWRADRAGLSSMSRTVELRDSAGAVVATSTGAILPSHPTSTWQNGELFSDQVRLNIPAPTQSGRYVVWLRVGSSPVAEEVGQVTIVGPIRTFASPPVARPVNARFGSFATLLGDAAIDSTAARGQTLTATLDWTARATADRPYTVFVHLVDPVGKIQAQIDQPPGGGNRPTNGWVTGEFLSDHYALKVAESGPTGSYQIVVGLYDATTGARVPVDLADGTRADHVVLATVQVS